jgi:four helix bundle protein
MRDFKSLTVWQKAHALTLEIYRNTESFPRTEVFGLTSQIRRAASSVEANLAEGCGRAQPEFGRFVQIAIGSANEVECHLLLARDLGFIPTGKHAELLQELIRGTVYAALAAQEYSAAGGTKEAMRVLLPPPSDE